MVLAGAGSGKTRVLTYRIAYMLAHGVNPYRILALTFTNKAAAEMRARIISLVGGDMAKAVTMGTFHSVFYRILRAEADKLGFTHNLTVYDTDDSKSLIKSIVKEMNLDPKVYAPNHILNRISMAKSNLLSAQEYADNHDITTQDAAAGKPHIAQIFARYNARLRNADAMDFDDLLYFMNVLLRDFPDMLYKYQNRYNYILVDEYQDTNFAQYLIVKKLAAAHQNLCVVGDDAQSIYGFRGADIQNILNFRRDFPLARIYKLEQNYRSTQNIVNAANAIIKNNKDQMPKEVWTSNEKGARIQLIHSNSDTDEAVTVANAIFETKMNEHADNRQFAILYRTNIQSRTLEEALVKRNIPYKIYGGLSFYKRKEIKDLLAYFRLTVNHYDEESLRRVINYPMRGIGDTTVARIATAAQENNVHFWDVVCDPAQYNLSLGATANKVVEFADMIKGFTAQLRTTDAYELGKHIALKSGILKMLKDNTDEKERVDHLEELLDAIKSFTEKEPESSIDERTGELIEEYFPSLDHFMESIALLRLHHGYGGEPFPFVDVPQFAAGDGGGAPAVLCGADACPQAGDAHQCGDTLPLRLPAVLRGEPFSGRDSRAVFERDQEGVTGWGSLLAPQSGGGVEAPRIQGRFHVIGPRADIAPRRARQAAGQDLGRGAPRPGGRCGRLQPDTARRARLSQQVRLRRRARGGRRWSRR